jgi:hypothetical protein
MQRDLNTFGRRPAGAPDLTADLETAREIVAQLRRELGELRTVAAVRRGGGLVGLDIARAQIALGSADVALERAHRHAGLEEAP